MKWILLIVLLIASNNFQAQSLEELLVNINSVDSATMMATTPDAEGGHLVYNTDAEMLFVWKSTEWIILEALTSLSLANDSTLVFANENGDTTMIILPMNDVEDNIIDSATFENDTLKIYEGETPVKVRIPNGGKYEKVVIWAEEAGTLSDNTLEWSFGDRDVGYTGIPLPEDWEAYAVSFHADFTSSAFNTVEIDVIDINENESFNILFSFTASGADDNMVYTEILTSPVAIQAGTTLGFRTNEEIGAVSSARVAVWLRR